MADETHTKRRIEGHTIYSAHLSEERTIKVYLPPGFDSQTAYPILYCHDGNEFFTHGRIATIANEMIANAQLSPLLIAGIAVNMDHRTEDYALSGKRHEAYLRFVEEECIPFAERRYPVSRDPSARAMAGISLGAVATLHLASRMGGRLSNVLLFSGAYYDSFLTFIRERSGPDGLAAYMVAGLAETVVDTPEGTYDFLTANRNMKAILEEQGAAVSYHEGEGKHVWGFWQRELPAALKWLSGQLPTPRSAN
ncbi:MAG: alpha/beta hydrolase [Bacilli bacterium]